MDDYDRPVWFFILKHKFEASDRIIYFHKTVKTQFGKLIKRIRYDNGGEFISNRMDDLYNEQGIILETTCPHTPQQNGVVERKHRHLLETARALRFEANLPKRFWDECVMTAAYIINRLLSKIIDNKTPFEVLFKEKPDYEHILEIPTQWETNSKKGEAWGIFGLPTGNKGVKLYNIKHNKIMLSRDVKFVENIFPYRNAKPVNRRENENLFSFHPWYYKTFDAPQKN